MKPILEELEQEYSNLAVNHFVIDEGDNMKIAREWRITAVPTFVLIKHGEEVDRWQGASPKSEVEKRIEGYLQREVLPESSGGSENSSGTVLCSSGECSD